MKQFISIILSIFLTATLHGIEDFDITLKPKWNDLDPTSKKSAEFGGKWILAGSITFKKRSKEPIYIHHINLRWKCEPIDNLISSLYKKDLAKAFLPIE